MRKHNRKKYKQQDHMDPEKDTSPSAEDKPSKESDEALVEDDKKTTSSESPSDTSSESLDNESPDDEDDGSNEQEQTKGEDQDAPADALGRTPEELEEEEAERIANEGLTDEEPVKKEASALKKFFRKVNVYFLIFAILVVVAGAIAIVTYLNSQQTPTEPEIVNQELTEEALRSLANTDASVGSTSQTLTIQGNAVIAGQSLMRGALNVAGSLQTGGSLQAPSITISGSSNFNDTQIDSLQVAANTAIQGSTTMRDLNVAGTSTFNGAMSASQITVSRLIMSGNAVLEIPNHISITGPSPRSTVNRGVVGGGGSASISGSDTAGVVNISTGNNPSSGCFVDITFNRPFSSQPRVNVTPIGSAAGQTQHYVNRSATGFSICSANVAPANQNFAFDYFIVN